MSEDGTHNQCEAHTRFKPTRYESHHTVRCRLEAGHEGLHEWAKDARTVMWGGPATRPDESTRLRFGEWLEEGR